MANVIEIPKFHRTILAAGGKDVSLRIKGERGDARVVCPHQASSVPVDVSHIRMMSSLPALARTRPSRGTANASI